MSTFHTENLRRIRACLQKLVVALADAGPIEGSMGVANRLCQTVGDGTSMKIEVALRGGANGGVQLRYAPVTPADDDDVQGR